MIVGDINCGQGFAPPMQPLKLRDPRTKWRPYIVVCPDVHDMGPSSAAVGECGGTACRKLWKVYPHGITLTPVFRLNIYHEECGRAGRRCSSGIGCSDRRSGSGGRHSMQAAADNSPSQTGPLPPTLDCNKKRRGGSSGSVTSYVTRSNPAVTLTLFFVCAVPPL